ncbi:MAG: amidohydrolase family protein, partial [Oscillospiraceae bacterium]
MILKNLYIENEEETKDIKISNGKIEEIAKDIRSNIEDEVIDMKGKLLLPPFIESHIHLDTCLTAGEPVWNMSGTLFEGIECWSKRKGMLTKKDVKDRVNKCVRMQASYGVGHIRTHIDVTDPKLIALEALLELKQELKDYVNIQIVAFPQEGILSYRNGKELMVDAIKLGADVIGAIPHFEFTREYSVESLNFIMGLAEKYDKLVDVHCDEIDDESSRGLETLATRAYESGLK